jgi:oligoribonuclease
MRRALDDIRGSMRELKFYRDNLFIPVEAKSTDKVEEKNSDSSAERLVEKMKAL